MLLQRLFTVLACAAAAVAQSARPSNRSAFPATNANTTITLVVSQGTGEPAQFWLNGLTQAAIDNLPHDKGNSTGLDGTLFLVNPATSSNISSRILAFTACDEALYSTGQLSMTDVINAEIQAGVQAIIFYSLEASFCNISGNFNGYTALYTMTDLSGSWNIHANLPKTVQVARYQYQATIFTSAAFRNFVGRSGVPGTAVAMIILYSITGVITLTFLSIIITGAIRAHRHPERYGPRNLLGRPTQSRARGIARAILDTLPIVKFGSDKVEPKQVDVELGGSTQTHAHGTLVPASSDSAQRPLSESKRPSADLRHTESGSPAAAASAEASRATEDGTEEGLGCSICTDDFEHGQDIRVLPCNHKFHPACVDPWLLDVSGTCPLCRIDLRPQRSGSNATAEAGEAGQGGLAPPLDSPDDRRRTTVRRFFAGARTMDRQQRIDALRRWRMEHGPGSTAQSAAQNVAHSSPATQNETAVDTQRRQSRLRGLFRRA